MPRLEERQLAARLARVLDGREEPGGEAGELAALLERAAEGARLEVDGVETEEALARARRRPLPPPRRAAPRLALGAAGAVLAAAVGVVIALVLGGGSGIDVGGRALAAIGGPRAVIAVEERIEPAERGLFAPSRRVGWLDGRFSRAHWLQYDREGILVVETLVEGDRISRYLVPQNVLVVARSCRALASGCVDALDPVAVYRDALAADGGRAHRTGDAYVLTLPVQTAPGAVPVEQRVTIDAESFLPRLIEWRDRGRTIARIRVTSVRRLSRDEASGRFDLTVPTNTRIVQRALPGRPLRLLGTRTLSPVEAGRLVPGARWLGLRFRGRPLVSIREFRWNAGTALRIDYAGGLRVWDYGPVVPPELVAVRYVPAKAIPRPGGIARFYGTQNGRIVAELDRGTRVTAILAPPFGKEDLFDALERLRRLR